MKDLGDVDTILGIITIWISYLLNLIIRELKKLIAHLMYQISCLKTLEGL